jgi:hypothetical protein
MTTPEITAYIFGGSASGLAAPVGRWIAASPRFKLFATTYRDKIRKKARAARDPEAEQDLQAELATAYWLLAEPRCALEYEPYAAEKTRGPDFAVIFRTHVRFNVEVTRLRAAAAAPDEAAARRERIARAVCAKLPQMPPSAINVLALVREPGGYEAEDLPAALHALIDAATRRDDAFFTRRGFLGARDFGRQLQRISAVLLRPAPADEGQPGALWRNPQAKHPLPPDIARILSR